MRTIETTVYEFGELSDSAKERARDWCREGALDYEWWDSTYEDAARIGLKLKSFDLDRNRHATGAFTEYAVIVAEKIIKEHGESCETFKTATAYLANIGRTNEEGEREAFSAEFERSLIEDYSIILQNEYEYLLSDEAVDESILCNGYTFTEAGKRCG
jgi:hypothetical protein